MDIKRFGPRFHCSSQGSQGAFQDPYPLPAGDWGLSCDNYCGLHGLLATTEIRDVGISPTVQSTKHACRQLQDLQTENPVAHPRCCEGHSSSHVRCHAGEDMAAQLRSLLDFAKQQSMHGDSEPLILRLPLVANSKRCISKADCNAMVA